MVALPASSPAASPAHAFQPFAASMPECIALADCNNFYASCETVFRPSLAGKPVIVLSNNDGCVIARSKEAKKLGIKMGVAVHEIRGLIKHYNVQVCSANFALYGDMSQRVMSVFGQTAPMLDVYSIDEAFMDFTVVPPVDRLDYAARLRAQALEWTGITVSVGVAPTKTLAKAANEVAKKLPAGVVSLMKEQRIDRVLHSMPVEDIWGIGTQRGKFLRQHGIETAYQFKQADSRWVKRHLYIPVARTQLELRGIPCLPLIEMRAAKQEIMCSQAFGQPITDLAGLKEAVALYASRACEKLRGQHSLASVLTVFITTNSFRTDEKQYHKSATITLPRPTAYTAEIISAAHRGLERIYRDGFRYHKAGVMLADFTSDAYEQAELFSEPADPRQAEVMRVMDAINSRFGRDTIHVAATGKGKPQQQDWGMKQQLLSPHYTTRWDELVVAH